jgi:hypothetical protein
MDPELGMGIEFMGRTVDHHRRLEELIQQIKASPDSIAEALVEPEGLDWENAAKASLDQEASNDPLLELFRSGATLSRKEFLDELKKHELAATVSEAAISSTAPKAHQRREPRIAVSLPVQICSQDDLQESASQATSMIEVSHHGARIDDATIRLKPGDVVHLLSSGQDARFRVIWVGEPNTPQEGQVGLQTWTKEE